MPGQTRERIRDRSAAERSGGRRGDRLREGTVCVCFYFTNKFKRGGERIINKQKVFPSSYFVFLWFRAVLFTLPAAGSPVLGVCVSRGRGIANLRRMSWRSRRRFSSRQAASLHFCCQNCSHFIVFTLF